MTTETQIETGHFLEIPQGYALDLTGQAWKDVLIGFLELSIRNVQAASSPLYWRPFWLVQTNVRVDQQRPALGYEQYRIGTDGTLGPRVTNWDSAD